MPETLPTAAVDGKRRELVHGVDTSAGREQALAIARNTEDLQEDTMGSTVATELYAATRLNNSVNGNPRYTLHTTDGDYMTSSDAACSYSVGNYLHAIRRTGRSSIRVELVLTRAGRVSYMHDLSKDSDETHPDA